MTLDEIKTMVAKITPDWHLYVAAENDIIHVLGLNDTLIANVESSIYDAVLIARAPYLVRTLLKALELINEDLNECRHHNGQDRLSENYWLEQVEEELKK